jgi:hypothetical protein
MAVVGVFISCIAIKRIAFKAINIPAIGIFDG